MCLWPFWKDANLVSLSDSVSVNSSSAIYTTRVIHQLQMTFNWYLLEEERKSLAPSKTSKTSYFDSKAWCCTTWSITFAHSIVNLLSRINFFISFWGSFNFSADANFYELLLQHSHFVYSHQTFLQTHSLIAHTNTHSLKMREREGGGENRKSERGRGKRERRGGGAGLSTEFQLKQKLKYQFKWLDSYQNLTNLT